MTNDPRHLELDLDRVVDEYVRNLNVMLRGFRAVEGCDFLETFVPSEDPTASIRDLVELSRDAGVRTLTITMSTRTASTLDQARLERETGPFTTERTRDGLQLVFSDAPAADWESSGIHPAYRQRLAEVLTRITHEHAPPGQAAGLVVTATRDGITLWAVVDRTSHVVLQAGFSGASRPSDRGMLEALCRHVELTPLVEAADHAAIRVEAFLRDPDSTPPVSGVILPRNAGVGFQSVERLVRDLLTRYRSETGWTDVDNMFDQPVAEAWLRSSNDRRLEAARAAVASVSGAASLEIVRVDGLRRLVVRFDDGLDRLADQQSLLVRVEGHLRKALQTPLQLVLEAKADKNAIRHLETKKHEAGS